MTKILCVGAVPQAVVAHIKGRLEATGGELAQCDLSEPSDRWFRGTDLVVLHATPTASDVVDEWQAKVLAANLRMALTIAGPLDARASRLLFHPTCYPLVPLNVEGDANVAAIHLFLRHLSHPDPPRDEDIPIGRKFKVTNDLAEYSHQRFLSLASMGMHDFLFDLRAAIEAMSVPIDNPRDLPPWNLDVSAVSAITGEGNRRKIGTGTPTLDDLFTLPHDNRARSLLRAAELDKARSFDPPNLLIRGESGSGKTLVADLVHQLLKERVEQPRMPMVTVNCAALTAQNLDFELFGVAPNVYSDITRAVVGLLSRAAYGVAFLDEIGDLDMTAQQRFLVVLSSRQISPMGVPPFPGYLRFVAATNRDIPHLVDQQRFRNDLHERFQKRVVIPPLRDREPSEIEWLIDFVAINPHRNPNGAVTHIGADAMGLLLQHEYRNGNVRELETVVHDGIDRARRRGSKCLRAADLSFADVRTVADTESRIVDVSSLELSGRPVVVVADAKALHRLAELANAPILRTDDGALTVVAAHLVYRFG